MGSAVPFDKMPDRYNLNQTPWKASQIKRLPNRFSFVLKGNGPPRRVVPSVPQKVDLEKKPIGLLKNVKSPFRKQ